MSEAFTIQDYHDRSKHHLDHYARGPQTLDWDGQPDPFRTYEGAPKTKLSLCGEDDDTGYAQLFQPGAIAPKPLDHAHISLLLELSMGLSAWKRFGPDRWSLRINPSSGNLHPTECYLILPDIKGIDAGVYHYHSYGHQLEQRCALQGPQVPGNSFLIGLSSIHKRESWKYGERAYRYCQHDVGHALAALRYACAILGWRLTLLDECSDEQIATLLGIDREADFGKVEHESPDILIQIDTVPEQDRRIDVAPLLEAVKTADWTGQANRLTDDNFYKWPVIPQAEAACRKPVTEAGSWRADNSDGLPAVDTKLSAAAIIRQRRSAQAFDGAAPPLGQAHFKRMLECLLPRPDVPPLDCLPWAPRIHIVLFVHRIAGLESGLYALPRSESGKHLMQQQFSDGYAWQEVEGLPAYLLKQGQAGNSARTLACHQPIASDSAFSLAMLAEFDDTLVGAPWRYRQLYWEAGVIGQSLYLEAEAAGVRGTGIGCFFDDALHEMLGIKESVLQDLYHFTVGKPRIDDRLQSEPPYAHLEEL